MANADDEDAERRHEQRAPIELKVEYKRLNTFLYDYTKNISNGGTFIKTDRPLEVGAVFLFKLQIPGLTDAISLRGEVRWVIKPGEAPPPDVPPDHEPGMGIRFVYDSDQQRELIEQSVEKLMIDSLGPLIYARLVGEDPGRDGGAAAKTAGGSAASGAPSTKAGPSGKAR